MAVATTASSISPQNAACVKQLQELRRAERRAERSTAAGQRPGGVRAEQRGALEYERRAEEDAEHRERYHGAQEPLVQVRVLVLVRHV